MRLITRKKEIRKRKRGMQGERQGKKRDNEFREERRGKQGEKEVRRR